MTVSSWMSCQRQEMRELVQHQTWCTAHGTYPVGGKWQVGTQEVVSLSETPSGATLLVKWWRLQQNESGRRHNSPVVFTSSGAVWRTPRGKFKSCSWAHHRQREWSIISENSSILLWTALKREWSVLQETEVSHQSLKCLIWMSKHFLFEKKIKASWGKRKQEKNLGSKFLSS